MSMHSASSALLGCAAAIRRLGLSGKKNPSLCVYVNNSLFSNPYHRSPQCQPELSHSPLALADAREGQINMNLQLHTCRGTLASSSRTLWDLG